MTRERGGKWWGWLGSHAGTVFRLGLRDKANGIRKGTGFRWLTSTLTEEGDFNNTLITAMDVDTDLSAKLSSTAEIPYASPSDSSPFS